jgi:Ca2+-binding RTX toxin-like protein
MSLSYYYVDSWGNKCVVQSDCVTQHSDGSWYDDEGHECHEDDDGSDGHGKLDGIVQGTAANDLIDYNYTGDPQGDRIDHNDQILSGAARNDDLVYAYAGNDTVLAGEGNDKVYGGDGHDSLSGGNGNDTLYGDAGNDTLMGGAGNNISYGGAGDDRFVGGAGADTFDGGTDQDNLDYAASGAGVVVNLATGSLSGGDAANDHINGGIDGAYGSAYGDSLSGFDGQGTAAGDIFTNQFYGNGGNDTISGLGGNDQLYGGNDQDLIYGGTGDDLVSGDAGNDTLYGDDGKDTVYGGDGRDLVYGGAGNDVIDTSTGLGGEHPDIGYPGLYAADGDVNNDKDTVYGGAGDDTIRTGDDADSIHGDDGNDSIDGGVDNDTIYGDAGNDTLIGGEGSDVIDGGTGDDLIYGGYGAGVPDAVNIPDATDLAPNNGMDSIHGGDGNDTIFGMDDKDTLYGDAGNDSLDGGIDDDKVYGGDGNDTVAGGDGNDTLYGDAGNDHLYGGTGNDVEYGGDGADTMEGGTGNDSFYAGSSGADSLSGGDDRDSFFGGHAGENVDGGEGGDDHDTLDLTGAGPLHIIYDPANPENGTVQFLDPINHHVTGTMTFKNIENVIPCFTPGTLIATPRGEVPVEHLREGDRIITRDNGMQEIRWVGRRDLSWADLTAAPHLKPVLVRQGSLGNGLPEVDMMVSPNHRLLVANDRTALYFDEHEVLVAAKHLITSKGVVSVDAAGVSYIHFMCDRHEVVLSNGAWTESFQPGDMTLKGMGNAQRSEIFDIFPELKTPVGLDNYTAARKTLKRHEAALLVR